MTLAFFAPFAEIQTPADRAFALASVKAAGDLGRELADLAVLMFGADLSRTMLVLFADNLALSLPDLFPRLVRHAGRGPRVSPAGRSRRVRSTPRTSPNGNRTLRRHGMTFRIRFGERDAIDPMRCPPVSDVFARARLRREIEDDIERRLEVLDLLDGDPNTEDDGCAEHWLGWSKSMATGNGDDREEDIVPIEHIS